MTANYENAGHFRSDQLLFFSPRRTWAGRHRIEGERGGKGGAMRGAKNGFGATPYFLVIANDQEG